MSISVSCQQPNQKIKEADSIQQLKSQIIDTTVFKTAVVINQVKCIADTNQSYVLYLPSTYNKKQLWPIIFFFDSHAEGALPIGKYKELAEKYGFVIACSNNSKNGQAGDECNAIIQKFMNDVLNRFAIDNKRIYTSGFSGGARVAAIAAMTRNEIVGVIGCGAGFPNTNGNKSVETSFEFVGIVGNGDFNYTELKRLDNSLQEKNIPHQLLVFNGKHEWPAIGTMEQAFWWLECNSMREGRRSVDQSIITSVKQMLMTEISANEKIKNKAELYFSYLKAVNYLHELDDISQYENKANELKNSGQLQQMLQHMQELEKAEASLQQQYASAFASQNWDWWNKEIDKMFQISKNTSNAEQSVIHKRLISYLSLVAYMFSTKAIQVNQLADADLCLRIYEKVDPENSEHAYLFAEVYMKQNNAKRAIEYLQKAVKLGFNDKDRLSKDPVFSSLNGQKEFDDLMR